LPNGKVELTLKSGKTVIVEGISLAIGQRKELGGPSD